VLEVRHVELPLETLAERLGMLTEARVLCRALLAKLEAAAGLLEWGEEDMSIEPVELPPQGARDPMGPQGGDPVENALVPYDAVTDSIRASLPPRSSSFV